MAIYAAGIEYIGTAYSGWQRQQAVPSVQQFVEEAFSQVADESIKVGCAGRTDTGVHAKEQVIHFESQAKRSDYAWRMGCNTHLPKDIRVLWCHQVKHSFDARFSALSRSYRYVIHNALSESALLKNRVNWVPYALNVEKMNTAAQYLVGENDFTSFRASGCQSNTPFRNIIKIGVLREHDLIFVDITANAFLHHMVRNIVGSLIEVGREKKAPEWIAELLSLKNRSLAGVTALGCGLYFERVTYPDEFKLQQRAKSFCFY